MNLLLPTVRRVWRYQRGNQNAYIEEEQWPKEKVQKDKQRSTKHTYKTKDQETRTSLKPGGEFRCSGTNTNNVNKTWALLQTTGGKDEPNMVFNRIS